MIRDAWSTRTQAVLADAVRASLDTCHINLGPRAERALIIELADLLEALGIVMPEHLR